MGRRPAIWSLLKMPARKKAARREWTQEDVRELKAMARQKTPARVISRKLNSMRRSLPNCDPAWQRGGRARIGRRRSSPVRWNTRPWWDATIGSRRSLRSALSRIRVAILVGAGQTAEASETLEMLRTSDDIFLEEIRRAGPLRCTAEFYLFDSRSWRRSLEGLDAYRPRTSPASFNVLP